MSDATTTTPATTTTTTTTPAKPALDLEALRRQIEVESLTGRGLLFLALVHNNVSYELAPSLQQDETWIADASKHPYLEWVINKTELVADRETVIWLLLSNQHSDYFKEKKLSATTMAEFLTLRQQFVVQYPVQAVTLAAVGDRVYRL